MVFRTMFNAFSHFNQPDVNITYVATVADPESFGGRDVNFNSVKG